MKKYFRKFIKSLITLNHDQLELVIQLVDFNVSNQSSGTYTTKNQFTIQCEYTAIPQIDGGTHEEMMVIIQNGEEIKAFVYSFELGTFNVLQVVVGD